MKALMLLFLLLTGCTLFQRQDVLFRSRVSDVNLQATNSYADSRTGISDSSSLGVDFKLRDPSKNPVPFAK